MNSPQESMSRKNKEARRRVIYQGTEFMVPSVQSRCPSRRDKSARTNILSDTRGCLRSVNQHWSGERKQHPGWLRNAAARLASVIDAAMSAPNPSLRNEDLMEVKIARFAVTDLWVPLSTSMAQKAAF